MARRFVWRTVTLPTSAAMWRSWFRPLERRGVGTVGLGKIRRREPARQSPQGGPRPRGTSVQPLALRTIMVRSVPAC
jgi:hypothetical protein